MKGLIDDIKRIAVEAGRDPDALRFNAQVVTVLAEDDDKAWELARHPNPGWIAIAAASIDAAKTWEKWGYEHPLGDFNWSRDVNVNIVTKERAAETHARRSPTRSPTSRSSGAAPNASPPACRR